ncbi:MAG: protein phosphatase 2C domain-containing protein [Rubrimonas sp.]
MAADVSAVRSWRIAAARRCGEAHARRGQRCQDAFAHAVCGPDSETLLIAIADGAGSAARGGAGAALAVRAAVAAGRLAMIRGGALSEDLVRSWVETARSQVLGAASASGFAARDCATTLIVAASDGRTAVASHIGDGAVAVRDARGWSALSWPDIG